MATSHNQPIGAPGFTAHAARPLGKGYSEIMQMVLSYAVAGKSGGNPTLLHSLDQFRKMPGIAEHFAKLPRHPRVLIQGYSTPGNASALRQFLTDYAPPQPRIETIDLYDLPHLYAVLDIEMPDMIYHIADAAYLEGLYQDHSIDLVVQDFLLNCIPASRHEDLLQEVSRVLKPGGLVIMSFTSSENLEISDARSTDQLQAERHLRWNPQAYDLSEMGGINQAGEPLDYLKGELIYHQPTSVFIFVSKAGGRFEFFRAREQTLALFSRCGLESIASDVTQGSDDHGLTCTRHRCLLARRSPSS
jgi:SAM-dependent methyltransferase